MRPSHVIYRGERLRHADPLLAGCRVTVNGRRLRPERSQRVWAHTPYGFEWGYRGAGPSQLALALVLDATDSSAIAGLCYGWFRDAVVSQWGDVWAITAGEIRDWVQQWKRENPSSWAAFAAEGDEIPLEGGAP